MHLPTRRPGDPDFLYLKNQQAAFANVLMRLVTQMRRALLAAGARHARGRNRPYGSSTVRRGSALIRSQSLS